MSHNHVSKQEALDNGVSTENYEGGVQMDPPMQPLRHYATADTVTIPTAIFESMYLNPPTPLKNALRNNLGNPTPLGLLGFMIASSSLACTLMGWRGAGGGGAALVGVFYFFGGMLQVIGCIMEWGLGNTFISVVFGTYGAFWIMMGATLTPYFNAEGAYTKDLTGEALKAGQQQYFATFAFAMLFVGLINLWFTICSLRTNVIMVIIFVFVELALLLVAGAYWVKAEGKVDQAERLEVAAGACAFVYCVFGWYLELHLLLQAVDFPFGLPVFDLSHIVKGASELKMDNTEQLV